MAYIPQQIPKEEENQFALNQQTTPNPIPPQGSGSTGTAGANRAAPGMATSTQFGSNAANLSDYLKANEGQVGEYGQRVANDLSDRYNQTMGSIDQGYGNFGQQIQGQYAPPQQNELKSAIDNPADFVKDSGNVDKFKSWSNPQYNGPQSFEDSSVYSDINDKVNRAVQDAGLTKTQSGLGTYLNNYFGANNNTEGMRTLDTALLQRDPTSSAAIKNAAKPYENLQSYLTDTTSKANQNIGNVKNQINQSGQDVRAQTQGATDKFTKDIQDRISNLRTQGQSDANVFKNYLTDVGSLSPEDQARGRSMLPENFSRINFLMNQAKQKNMQFDPLSYLTTQNPEVAYNTQNVPTSDEFAKEAALQQLTGGGYDLFDNNASQAGTAPSRLFDFNSGQAEGDLKNMVGDLTTPSATNNRMRTAVNATGDGMEQQWYDGSKWVTAPQESISNNDGTWSKFNYNTGQYEVQPGKQPTASTGMGLRTGAGNGPMRVF